MITKIIKISSTATQPALIDEAADLLKAGGIIAFPTETVYGMAARLDNEKSVRRLRRLKKRVENEPFTVQVASAEDAIGLLKSVPVASKPLMKHFWPGPLTIVFPDARISAGGKGLGIRVPASLVAQAILKETAVPLVVSSANTRGEVAALTGEDVLKHFPEGLDLVLDGGQTAIMEASTVVGINNDDGVEILRKGIVSREMIERLVCGRIYLFVCTGNTCRSPMAQMAASKYCSEYLGVTYKEMRQLGYCFLSAGISANIADPVSKEALQVLHNEAIPVSPQGAVRLTSELVYLADRIYCMTNLIRDVVLEMFPQAGVKAELLGEKDILDPVYGGLDKYRAAFSDIKKELLKIWPLGPRP